MFLFIQHLNILLLSLSSPHLSLNCHHTRALTDSEIREEERSEEQAKRMMRTTRRALSMTGVTLMLMMVVMMTMSGVDGVSHMDMSLGGVHYFSSLADPAASSQTRYPSLHLPSSSLLVSFLLSHFFTLLFTHHLDISMWEACGKLARYYYSSLLSSLLHYDTPLQMEV